MKIFVPFYAWLACLLWLGWSGTLLAQPLNFMVGDYVFLRPKAWCWVPLDAKAKIAAKLLVTNEVSGEVADVVFVESKIGGGWASAAATLERWQNNFEEPEEKQNWRREERAFGQRTVTFLWQEGTYKTILPDGKKRMEKGFAQYGMVLADGKNNILARILGRKAVVEKARMDFKRMVEDSLQESE